MLITFKNKDEFISYLLKHKRLFDPSDQIIIEFDFILQEYLRYLQESEKPSKSRDALLGNIHFKGIAYFSLFEVRTMTFTNCIFNHGLHLENIHIFGDLRLITTASFLLDIKNCIIEKDFTTSIVDESVIFNLQTNKLNVKGKTTIKTKTKQPTANQNISLQSVGSNNTEEQPLQSRDIPFLQNQSPTVLGDNDLTKNIFSTNSSTVIAPLLVNSTFKGEITVNADIGSYEQHKVLDLKSMQGFTQIASNSSLLFDLVMKDCIAEKLIDINAVFEQKDKIEDIKIKDLDILSNYQFLSINSSFISAITIDSSTIKGGLKSHSKTKLTGNNPYNSIEQGKYISANASKLSVTNISNSSLKELLVDFNIESIAKKEDFSFRSKEDFFNYLKSNIEPIPNIIIGNKKQSISLNFDFSLDNLIDFIKDKISLSPKSIHFTQCNFKKNITLSNQYNILLVFDNCKISNSASHFLSRVVPQQVDILYYN